MGEKGIIISGKFGEIIAREKKGEKIELGELLICESKNSKTLMQAYDLSFASQISQANLELISGMKLEESCDFTLMDENIRSYNLAYMKNILNITQKTAHLSKTLPDFFSSVREVTKDDLKFLTKPNDPLFLGKLRSGSKPLDIDIYLPCEKVLSHHILICAATGKGKSNLASVMLWDLAKNATSGIIVLDPHDEYYGRHGLGLKDHPNKGNVVYYTVNSPPVGARTLKINLKDIRPEHLNGVFDFSGPQKEALNAYFRKYNVNWIDAIIKEKELGVDFHEGTLGVVKRRILSVLDLEISDNKIYCNGAFDLTSGETTIKDICNEIENKKIVIIDTSTFPGNTEILIGSLIASEIFSRYKYYKNTGELNSKGTVSIFIEEAPRVIGKDALEAGPNIFSTIAREGRKFKIGLTAITQLPSLIPKEILANINTKIILGIEMAAERTAIIESAAQDLSSDSRQIASLDKGEAIITSNFARFAIPVKIPLFSEYTNNEDIKSNKKKENPSYDGISIS